ncbi:helix-turn-helix transcriptional regulator [Bacillus sp. FJAT-45037]|uniref:helix-turn-helix transcriptional regulator n=1 Tax=Bacillus sp. FJAT-45037 TaxID=2011007 RepID=UPI000C249CDB|nr:helix-turn-helix transcriptional regulator [Bacillus sp. FJAT-45037]
MSLHRHWLQKIRQQKELTQGYVADNAGIQRAYYAQIELGSRRPSVDVAKSIAIVLDFQWTLFFEDNCSVSRHNDEHLII